jgi:hypothetical protein
VLRGRRQALTHVHTLHQPLQACYVSADDGNDPAESDGVARARAALTAIEGTCPLLLKPLASDLLYLVVHGEPAQRAASLELASAGAKHIEPLNVLGKDRDRVRSRRLCFARRLGVHNQAVMIRLTTMHCTSRIHHRITVIHERRC